MQNRTFWDFRRGVKCEGGGRADLQGGRNLASLEQQEENIQLEIGRMGKKLKEQWDQKPEACSGSPPPPALCVWNLVCRKRWDTWLETLLGQDIEA